MELQAVIGELYLLDGVVQVATPVPGLLVQPAPKKTARGRDKDYLFVHLSLTGRPEAYAETAQTLLNLIHEAYFQSTGSVTAALRKAIMTANQMLLRANMSKESPVRQGAVMCAVLREQELFMVQAGEAFALIARDFGVERLPDKDPQRMTPLGLTAGLDLRYFHNWLEPGDMMLLADPRLTNLPGDAMKNALVDSTVEDSLPRLKRIVGADTGRLLLVEFVDEAPVDLPAPVTPLVAGTGPAEMTGTKAAAGVAAAGVTAAAVSAATPSTGARQVPRRSVRPAEERHADPQSLASQPRPDLPSGEEVSDSARRASSRLALGLAGITAWLAEMMARMRPGRDETADDETGWAVPVAIAVLIPIIVAVIVTGVYVQRGRVQRMSQIKREMNQAIGLAQQTDEDLLQRQYYQEVLVLAAEAQALRPDDADIQLLRQTALVELDLIDDVTRLLGERLYTYPSGSDMHGVVLREGFNGDIYTHDQAVNRIFRHETSEDYLTLLGEAADEILFSGQAVGTHVTGRITDMIWRPSGQEVTQSSLAVLDASGAIINYIPSFSELRAVRLGLASEWQNPVSLKQFNERIYVLDNGAGVIWRYFPEGDGFYVDEEQRTLELPELDQAVDFDIYSEDGSVVVLYNDGRIRRYVEGSPLWDESTLLESGLDPPLVAPNRIKIIGRGLNSSIFVADPGSSRLIQLSLGGTFLAQYKAVDLATDQELFTFMSDFDVAEAPLRIFVVGRDGLFVARQN